MEADTSQSLTVRQAGLTIRPTPPANLSPLCFLAGEAVVFFSGFKKQRDLENGDFSGPGC